VEMEPPFLLLIPGKPSSIRGGCSSRAWRWSMQFMDEVTYAINTY